MQKYELTEESIEYMGRTLFRIRATTDFVTGDIRRVWDGNLGGYVESENNLTQKGRAWISDNAKVYGEAQISGNARIKDDAEVSGKAQVSGNAKIYGKAHVSGNAVIKGNAYVGGSAEVCGNAEINKNIKIENGVIDNSDAVKIQKPLVKGRSL